MHNSARLLSASASASSHLIHTLQHNVYSNLAYQFSLAPKARIGLAISGGVDSMALATICRDFKQKHNECNFTGFIVDHGVRPGSAGEASKVAEELSGLGILPEILKLDWSGSGNPKYLTNFETVARKLRYQTLGKACYQQGITKILTAHHGDDLAETVLSRIIAGYLGEGLQGMKSRTAIPECAGIYGVDASGTPRMPYHRTGAQNISIEGGGVSLHHPLLAFTKDQLIAICKDNRVCWFEDSTNADKTLTIRNTIRHLQRPGHIPAALERPRLNALAWGLQRKHRLYEKRANDIWNNMSIRLNLATGTASFRLPEGYSFGMTSNGQPYHVKALLARKLLMLVSPLQAISLQDIDAAMDIFFESPPATVVKGQVQGVTILHSQGTFTIHRQRPLRNTVRPIKLSTLKPISDEPQESIPHTHATDWHLWDNRYWIRILHSPRPASPPPSHFTFHITFLTPPTIHKLRTLTTTHQAFSALEHALYRAKPASKPTQPVVSVRIDDGKSSTIEVNQSEQIIALPALGWAKEDVMEQFGLAYKIRHKAVEFGNAPRHVFSSSAS